MDSITEQAVARHYGDSSIEEKILGALRATGKNVDHLTTDDLAPVDEFHIGGRPATVEIAAAMELTPGMHLLDVGCGIGGPARYFAAHHGARVSGIDLTREFVDTARALTSRLHLDELVSWHCGSALKLPFEDASFDGAYIFHVGMNISDKTQLFGEVRRVLKPGSVFAVYDVMRTGTGDLSFPVPWAQTGETSFVESPEHYRKLLQAAGFRITSERNRRAAGLEFFAAMGVGAEGLAPSPLGLPLVMGPTAPLKIGNMIAGLGCDVIAPVEMICRAV